MTARIVHRVAFGGVIILLGVAIAFSAVAAQSTGGSDPDKEDDSTRHHDTDINISGLSSSIKKGSSDEFTVVAELELGFVHTISVTASGGVGFNSTCSDKSETQDVANVNDGDLVDHKYDWNLTLYACGCSDGTVEASVSGFSDSQSVTVVNSSPTVTIDTSSQTVNGGSSVPLDATASDPENNKLEYSWSGAGSFADSSSLNTTWKAPDAQSTSRTYPLKVTVSDGCLSDTASVSMTVPPPPRTVSFSSSSYSVNEGSSRTITVEMSPAADKTYRIPVTVTRGTAESSDYSVSGLPLTFSSGDTSDTFTIGTTQDTDCDDERVNISFGSLPSGVNTGSPSSAMLRIDDDGCPRTVSFSSSSYSVNEGSSRTITVEMSPAADKTYTIPVTVTRGTAESSDYSVSGLPLTFSSGDTSDTFTIGTTQDTGCDDETVNISFGSLPSGVNAGSPSSSSLQIDDDDTCPTPTEPSVSISTPNQTVEGETTLSLTASVGGYPVPSVSWEGEGDFADASSANTSWTAPSEQQHAVPYDLILTAANSQSETSAKVTVTVRAIPGPAAPSLSSSNITSNSVQLNWSN